MDYFEQVTASPEGGTASLRDGHPLPTTGYFVGGIVSPLIFFTGELEGAEAPWNLETFTTYLIEQINADFLGWWTDEETGHLYVDGVTWHETEFEAGRIGRGRRELAIYDVARQRELRLVYVEGE